MAIIGAQHDLTITGIGQNIGDVVGDFAGDIHPVFSEQVLRHPPPQPAQAIPQIMADIGHPLSADLDKAPAEIREFAGNILFNQGGERAAAGGNGEGADHGQFKGGKGGVFGKQVMVGRRSVAGMETDRQVQFGGNLVQRIEIRIADSFVPLKPAHEDATGAVVLGLGKFGTDD